MNKQKVNRQQLVDALLARLRQVRRYSLLMFLAFVAVLYGFVLLRINNLTNAQPPSDTVSSQVQAAHVPRINPAVIKQLQSLQNNSVSVQALFDQARQNPFQE